MSKRNTTLPIDPDKQIATKDSCIDGKQIRKEQDRLHLRNALLAGAKSAATAPVDSRYFDALRNRAHQSR